MSTEIVVVFALLAVAVVLFATEWLPVDLVALVVMSALLVSGIVTPAEGVAGFGNPATVTVGAMFVLSAGLFKTGAVNFVGAALARLGRRSLWLALLAVMLGVGAVSAFINNTAAVAIFLPIMLGLAETLHVSPSKLLMPLSFASMFGGVCTLIGTSTNIVVSAIAERHGQPPFRMFEFLPLGLAVFACGLLYMLLVGVRLIPNRRTGEGLTQSYRVDEYLTDIVLLPESRSVGKPLGRSPLVREQNVAVSLDEAYAAVEWRIIFLLAGVLTLGTALEKTGGAQLLSGALLSGVGSWGPFAVVSGLFLLTGLLTNVMSNNASAALLAPVAVATAQSLGVSARPLLMAVTFAASLSFMTPVGYQTNTLIYGPGQYRFTDFLRIGTPLSLLLWLLASLLIPVF